MIKQTLYPKTTRIGNNKTVITEKLDGSNIGFFKWDDKLIVAQRNNVFTWTAEESALNKNNAYKGLIGWLNENGQELLDNLIDGSGFFGEWLGMGRLKYPDARCRVYMFAKANITWNDASKLYDVRNIYYDRALFIYPFAEQAIPDFVGVVPQVLATSGRVDVERLNEIYSDYVETVGREVEGFIIISGNNITKYVRNKGGGLTDHELPR